jgi:hypothetical protein
VRGICRDCGERVIFARTEALAWQPLNPEPDPAGNVHAYDDGRGNWLARSCEPGREAAPPDRLMMPHAATCAGKRKPAPAPDLPPGVTSLEKFRAARAAGKRDKASARGSER